MRTTYKPKNMQQNNQIKEIQPIIKKQEEVSQEVNENLQNYSDLYISIKEEVDSRCIETPNVSVKSVSEKKVNKSRKKSKTPLILLLLVIIIGVVLGLFYLKVEKDKKLLAENLTLEVNSLYTDEDKIDIKPDISVDMIKELQGRVEEASIKGIDLSSLSLELNTISLYVSDRDILNSFTDVNFDYNTVGFMEQLESINSNLVNYTVPNLSSNIAERINSIREDHNLYTSLKFELESVTDYLGFDKVKYEESINNVTHTPNKNELLAIYEGIVQKQNEAIKEASSKNDKSKKSKKKKNSEESTTEVKQE